MKQMNRYIIYYLISLVVLTASVAMAGNKDRTGQAGAPELLINPFAASSGWGGVNTGTVSGVESMFMNVAGLNKTTKMEMVFVNTQWLKSTGINVNAFGISGRVGETGVLGMSIMSMAFGDILNTTEEIPEGISTFAPKFININLAYAKAFSDNIKGGLTCKIISESIHDMTAQGVAFDAGIQYTTGEFDQINFGITLKNIGPSMHFSGNGLTFRGYFEEQENSLTLTQRSERFELPSLLAIGFGYDVPLSDIHEITIASNFVSNSFTNDQFTLGLEYRFKTYLTLRTAYTYEEGIFDVANRATAFSGPSAGFSVDVPIQKKKGSVFSIDYSYRDTHPFDGTHSLGIRINL